MNKTQDHTGDGDGALSHRELAALFYKERRERDVDLPAAKGLWGDPAWDMLLDLFMATEEGRMVNVTSACIGALVPSTTGLRLIAQLIKAGLVWRDPDPFDGRKGVLRLTNDTTTAMRSYLDRMAAARGLPTPIARRA